MDSGDVIIRDENRYKGRIDLCFGNVLYERKHVAFATTNTLSTFQYSRKLYYGNML